jgi:2-furoyl-CoA dehydrogenase FAD binding subunit
LKAQVAHQVAPVFGTGMRVALGFEFPGEVVLRSKAGRRVLGADQFFQGMLMTAVKPGEIVEEVRFPLRQQDARYAFEEVSMRHGDFAIVALAAVVTDSAIELTVGGVSDRPRRQQWARLSGADLDSAINDFAWELDAESDAHASAEYRRHLVRQLGRKLIAKAIA